MKLVRATAEDAEALAGVHAEGFPAPWSAADIGALMAGPGVFGFLVVADRPVGMILCRVAEDDVEVLTLAVASPARRQGVGRVLVRAAAQTGKAAGATAMFLEVASDNAPASALYEQAGFRRIALRTGYYNRGEEGLHDAVVMRLDLPAEPS